MTDLGSKPLDELLEDIFSIKDFIFLEAQDATAAKAARKAASDKKKKKAAKHKAKDSKRGNLDSDKAKKDTEHKKIDTGKFKNSESFSDTPEDALLHTDGKKDNTSLRVNKPSSNFAEVGNLKKNPADKKLPAFSGKNEKARTAASLGAAYRMGDQKAIRKLTVVAHSQGMKNVMGASWDKRPECKAFQKSGDASKLPKGYTAKMCKPHGQGGADEWLKKHHSDSTKAKPQDHKTKFERGVNKLKHMQYNKGHDTHKAQEQDKDKHEPSARHGGMRGKGKVYHPKHKKAGQLVMPNDISDSEKAHMLGKWDRDTMNPGEGGKHGNYERGSRRTLSKREQAKRGASGKDSTNVTDVSAKWHRLSKDQKGKKVK